MSSTSTRQPSTAAASAEILSAAPYALVMNTIGIEPDGGRSGRQRLLQLHEEASRARCRALKSITRRPRRRSPGRVVFENATRLHAGLRRSSSMIHQPLLRWSSISASARCRGSGGAISICRGPLSGVRATPARFRRPIRCRGFLLPEYRAGSRDRTALHPRRRSIHFQPSTPSCPSDRNRRMLLAHLPQDFDRSAAGDSQISRGLRSLEGPNGASHRGLLRKARERQDCTRWSCSATPRAAIPKKATSSSKPSGRFDRSIGVIVLTVDNDPLPGASRLQRRARCRSTKSTAPGSRH